MTIKLSITYLDMIALMEVYVVQPPALKETKIPVNINVEAPPCGISLVTQCSSHERKSIRIAK